MSTRSKSKKPIVVKGWTWGLSEEHSENAALLATRPKQLCKMADDILDGRFNFEDYTRPAKTLSCLIVNTHLPIEKARLLRLRTKDPDCLACLAARKDATAEILGECADAATIHSAAYIANHQNVKPETVARMAKKRDPSVILIALSSSRLPGKILDRFAKSKMLAFRLIVAEKTTNPKILAKLAFDPVYEIRFAAVQRDIIQDKTLEKVATTETQIHIVVEATRRLRNPDTLLAVYHRAIKRPVKNNSEAAQIRYLMDTILENPNASELVQVLIKL